MKLLTKTSLNYLSVTLFVFMFAIIAFYYLLRYHVNQNINIELEKRKNSIVNQLIQAHNSIEVPPNYNERILIQPLKEICKPRLNFFDTIIFEQNEKKYIPYRQLGFVANFNNNSFYIQIYKSLEETDNLTIRVFLIMTSLIIIIIIALLITLRHTSLKAWSVFYDTLKKISTYNINSHNNFTLQTSEVKEFEELNRVLKIMTERIEKDFRNIKEYTENASHEIQTPLAIINSKMELLLQSENLSEKQLKALVDAYEATNRLSKLNQTLLLLAKIENRQFPESKQIYPEVIIKKILDNLEDLIVSKNIHTTLEIVNNISLRMNPYLAEILFSNLIKNALRHNITGGELNIELKSDKFLISNSGEEIKIDKELLFERFNKHSSSPESMGLGLSIVRKICELYNFNIEYFYMDKKHFFEIGNINND